MDLINQLSKIQKDLKAPKNQFNSFGKYPYRSCEDILEGVKQHLNGLILTVSDEIVMLGDRFYIKATARITANNVDFIETTGYARESLTKKGMDESQITGTASSYARKASLSGLFLLDDTKDSDSNENRVQIENTPNWYNDFDKQKDLMLKKIQSGEQTAAGIISSLKKTGLVLSQKVVKQIEDLEK